MGARSNPDCYCDGRLPWCPPCVVLVTMEMRRDHPDSLSVSMLKRRIPRITGHEAALLVEASRLTLRRSVAVQTYVQQVRPARPRRVA